MAGRSLPWGRSCRQASRCFRAPAARAQLFVVHWYPALKNRSMVASVALFGNESSRTCSDFNFTIGALLPRNDSSPRLKKRVVFVSAIKADIADVGVGPRIPSGRHRRKGEKITSTIQPPPPPLPPILSDSTHPLKSRLCVISPPVAVIRTYPIPTRTTRTYSRPTPWVRATAKSATSQDYYKKQERLMCC